MKPEKKVTKQDICDEINKEFWITNGNEIYDHLRAIVRKSVLEHKNVYLPYCTLFFTDNIPSVYKWDNVRLKSRILRTLVTEVNKEVLGR